MMVHKGLEDTAAKRLRMRSLGHFRFRAYVVHFHSVCFRTVRELNSQGWRSPVREEKFTLVCSRSPKKKNLKLVISRCCFAEDGKEMYQNV